MSSQRIVAARIDGYMENRPTRIPSWLCAGGVYDILITRGNTCRVQRQIIVPIEPERLWKTFGKSAERVGISIIPRSCMPLGIHGPDELSVIGCERFLERLATGTALTHNRMYFWLDRLCVQWDARQRMQLSIRSFDRFTL